MTPPQDLVSLGDQCTLEAIYTALARRYDLALPYTRIGVSTLVAVNPNRPLNIYSEANGQLYIDQNKADSKAEPTTLEPHVFELASTIYYHMKHTGLDQGIVLSGLAGSGKTTSQNHLVQQFIRLGSSKSSQRQAQETKIGSQIRASRDILEAFCNCPSEHGPNSSFASLYLELQFKGRGRLFGAKLLPFMLNQDRVTDSHLGSFHIFYAMLRDASSEDRRRLKLGHNDHPSTFPYLATPPHAPQPQSSITAVRDITTAFSAIGIKSRAQFEIWQILAAILHLSRLEFIDSDQDPSLLSTVPRNRSVLELVAELLGVEDDALQQALVYKRKMISGDMCTVILNSEAARKQRDSLARGLYALLFTFVVEAMNKQMCRKQEEQTSFIGILDMPGFDNPTHAGFETLCNNFCNEAMQAYLSQKILVEDVQALSADDLTMFDPIPLDEQTMSTMDLLCGLDTLTDDGQPRGLVRFLHDATIAADKQNQQSSNAEADPSSMLPSMNRTFQSNSSFVSGSTYDSSFGIRHYMGQVQYNVSNFYTKNQDIMAPDFVSLFQTSESPFMLQLLQSNPNLVLESHPRSKDTIVKAQLSTMPLRQPSVRQKKMVQFQAKRKGRTAAPSVSTVVKQLHSTLHDICTSLDGTQLYQVIHLRPNSGIKQGHTDCDPVLMRSQIESFGLADLIQSKSKADFCVSYDHATFMQRYKTLLSHENFTVDKSASPADQCRAVANHFKWDLPREAAIGREYIWLSFAVWRPIEDACASLEKSVGRATSFEADTAEQHEFAKMMRSATADNGSRDHGLPLSTLSPAVHTPGSEAMEPLLERPFFRERHDSDASDLSQTYPVLETGFVGYDNNHPRPQFEVVPPSPMSDERTIGTQGADGDSRHHIYPGFDKNDMELKHRPTKSALKRNVSKLGSRRTKADESIQPPKAKTKTRRAWVAFVWCNTFWIPSFLLSWCGRMKRPDVQMAWREKVTLCLIVFWLSAFIIFFIVGVPKLMCPDFEKMIDPKAVQYHADPVDTWVQIRGVVYDVTKFAKTGHSKDFSTNFPSTGIPYWEPYRGQDLTEQFPVDLRWACPGLVTDEVLMLPEQQQNGPMPVHGPNPQNSVNNLPWFQDSAWFQNVALAKLRPMTKGMVAIPITDFRNQSGPNTWAMINDKIYDLTPYLRSAKPNPPFLPHPSFKQFLDPAVLELFENNIGVDITKQFNELTLDAESKRNHLTCLDRAFYAGVLDVRDTVKCQFGNWVLVGASALMAGVILIKFLAALQLRSRGPPIKYDKFVLCQVPCYTEGEESLRKTISSLAALEYDDKHKLLFIIADGMIVGHGNELPTPKIVLDVLGWKPPVQQDPYGYSAIGSVSENGEPEPVTYKALGMGGQQLNACKVYSGLYEFEGHLVPYIVVAKVGMPNETTKPGNRGKRDSQLILMKFLNAVHTGKKMCPLELELYHHMKNIIGVHPNLYEYIFQVDADTEVMPDSLNRLIACCVNDSRVIGLCGETQVANEDRSFTTMIQVYEYYISHHLAKSFESLFGSVTCLPGCFSIYRVFTTNGKPLIVANKVVDDYSHNDVDTLHKKNLLHLGEDRYLTTLMMKHFPQFKLKFTPDALCKTVAPDKWKVLLSQRRRWINSTIHNLGELMVLPELCGFCCFSMRFIVFVDLLGTLILPASFGYLVYLIVVVITSSSQLPYVALAMLAAVYGLQALIFILKGAWQHIGWMIIYILAMPFFSVFLPLYSFWHFDDFSWGNTRQVVDANGRKIVVNAEAQTRFDPNSIPLKSVEVFEAEQREKLAHSAAAAAAAGLVGTPAMSHVGPYSAASTSEHNLSNTSGQFLDPNYHAVSGSGGRTSPLFGHGNPYEYNPAASSDEMVHDFYRDSNAIEMANAQNNAKGQRLSRMSAMAGTPLLGGGLLGATPGTPVMGGVPRPVSPAQYFAEQREMKEQQERMRQASNGSGNSSMLMPPQHESGAMTIDGSGRVSPVSYKSSPLQQHQQLAPGGGMVLTMGTPAHVAGGGSMPMGYGGSGSLSPALASMAPPQIPFTIPSGSPALSPAMFHPTLGGGGATSPLMMTAGVPAGVMMPSDDELVLHVREILRSTVDLMSVTKRTIRQQLEQLYGCDLTTKKEFLSQVIDVELQRLATGAQ
ncbi:hypothetical protein BGW42_003041 [Actinomortierella wolfii]|nr:hypothetical protein BGW42_003041 [Actinomortierella wolfii]